MRLVRKAQGLADRSSLYVDRQKQLSALASALEWDEETLSRPMLFWGTGGVGKSALRRMFEAQALGPERVPHCVVDYDNDVTLRSPEATLLAVRHQLFSQGVRFPQFDLVWLVYWERTTGQKSSADAVPSELSDLADLLSAVPVVGSVAQTAVGVIRLSQPVHRALARRHAHLRTLSAMDLLGSMPEALAQDIEDSIGKRVNRGVRGASRIALIFDGYERLREFGIDDWFVRELFAASGSALKLVFGRDQLRWAADDPEWEGVFIERRLEPLDHEWCAEYLDCRGVSDEAAREAILELADGHPLFLEVAADLAMTMMADSEAWPANLDLDRNIEGLAGQLLDRLLRQLSGSERDAVLLAAIPRWFTVQVLETLLSEPASASRMFSMLSSYSFCSAADNATGALVVRKELRILLLSKVRGLAHWQEWNRRLAEFHGRAEDPGSLAECAYHALQADSVSGIRLLWTTYVGGLCEWDFALCYALSDAIPENADRSLERWRSLLRALVLEHAAVTETDRLELEPLAIDALDGDDSTRLQALLLLCRMLTRKGQPERALEYCLEALELSESLGDDGSRALALKSKGDVELYLGQVHEALDDYARATAVATGLSANELQTPLGHVPAGDILRAVGGALVRVGRIREAIEALEPLLRFARIRHSARFEAELLSELGLAYRRDGRHEQAIEAFDEARVLFDRLGIPISLAHVMCGKGLTLAIKGELEAGHRQYEEALAIFQTVGHFTGEAKCLQGEACIAILGGESERALRLLTRAMDLVNEVHDDVNRWPLLLDYAEALWRCGARKESLKQLEEASELVERLLDTPALCAVLIDRAIILDEAGDDMSARDLLHEAAALYQDLLGEPVAAQPEPGPSLTWQNRLGLYERDNQLECLASARARAHGQ